MSKTLTRSISIHTRNSREQFNIMQSLYAQLEGNVDFVNGNIDVRLSNVETIAISIFEGCKNVPKLII